MTGQADRGPATGEKARARDILGAIRTLKAVEAAGRPATTDERDILARFGGFGPVALSLFPDPTTGRYKDGWREPGEELKSLLTPEEYDSARRTVFSQFFTSPVVMQAMHDALRRLGVPDGATVLEPGCGTGRFMTGPHRYVGVELDSLSGRIARALHPDADVRIENFRDTKLPPLDAVIGNVPFADIRLEFQGQRLALHDYFIAKSVDSLKPGGVLAVVTSHYTLDKQNAAARELLAGQADFLGAIRLPSDAFKREGTQVVTDILFLRKRAGGQGPGHADADWLHVAPVSIEGADVPVNRYFVNHPEMVLGDWTRKDTLYGGEGYGIRANGDLESQLREAIGRLPGVEQSAAEHPNPPPVPQLEKENRVDQVDRRVDKPAFIPPPPLRHVTEGSFFVGEDRVIRQIVDKRAEPVVYGGTTLSETGTMTGKRLARLIDLRDRARRVLQSQNEGWPEAHRQEARRHLNYAYDRFLHDYGPINRTTVSETKEGGTIRRMPNLVKFREDPDAMLVMALEEYDEETGTAEKAAILKRDVVGPKPPVDHVATAEEGLLVSLDRTGAVDLPFIARLYGKPEAEIIAELGDLIYRDPESRRWETADAYLSGDVRARLRAADAAGPEFARNADALREVQPEDVLPGDIDANLGAPWIPASDIRAFAEELFGGSVPVSHLKKDAIWSLDPDYRALQSVAATTDYGTGRVGGLTLLEQALNLKTPAIFDVVRGPNGDERVFNPTETQAAREKQKAVKERFRSWVFAEPDRAERLVRIYNDTYNNLRPRRFDGSHLDFPGMSEAVTLKPHQVDAVWRCMSGGNTLLAHVVGAGKTMAACASAMKMKQAGLIHKPMVVVPNHMLEQFSREWLHLYPNAKLLVATKEDFARDRRKQLTAKIATGDWDGIIVTHSSFERIGMSKEYQERFIREQIAEYEELLADAKRSDSGRGSRNMIKQIEKQKAQFDERLKDLLAEDKKDDGLVFDELGVDQIIVDECFVYDTLIITDRGPMKIGDIVEKRVRANVLSWNSHTGDLEWKAIVGWFANKRRTPLFEVVNDSGSFICTPTHKIWVKDFGYKRVSELRETDNLLTLWHDLYSEASDDEVRAGQVLLGGMPASSEAGPQGMHRLRSSLLVSGSRPGNRSEEATAVLQRSLQDGGSASKSGFGGKVPPVDAADVGQPILDGQEKPGRRRMDEGKQSHAGAFREREGLENAQGDRPQAPHARRQWSPERAPDAAGGADRDDHRARHQHSRHTAPDGTASEALQSGFSRSGTDAGGGVGWNEPQFTEGEGAGRQEGQGLVASRVVGVKVLQPGRDGEYRFGGRSHSVVYDIEVADNHNYFANGVLVSNCQAFKNLNTPTKMDRVAGIQTGGSERAFDLYMKARYLDERHPGHGLVGMSGTPISNSMVEMYTMQRYFDPAGLASRGIEHFDAWAATFGEVVDAMEISPDGSTLRPRSRFAKFVNLPEVTQMFRSFADVQTAEMLDLPRPALRGGKPETVSCPMSEEQTELQAGLVRRYERIRNERVDPREDNALAITTDGRKLALDGRMLGAGEDFPGSKINALAANVARVWRETTPTRGTQLVFCDMGVNRTPWGFSAYEEVTRKLEERGIPRSQIAAVGDADTDAKKQVLFEKVRQGAVRVLIGSTQKMGTGTNVQRRLVALHHLDAPWKPAEVEQREGRILRQGNRNAEVSIYRYVTEGSFDAYMWQALETKARFINQVMAGDGTARSAEDIGNQELSYAEVKAIASGNPAVLTLAEADAELQRLAILRKNHADEQFMARRKLRELPDTIARLEKRVEGLAEDQKTVEEHADDPIVVAGRECDGKEVTAALGKRLDALPEAVMETRRYPLGVYRGLRLGLALYPSGTAEVELEGATKRHATLFSSSRGPRAVLNAAERLAGSYGGQKVESEKDLEVARDQLRDYEARLGAAFAHREYMDRLTELRDRLKLGLSERPPEGGEPVAEIAAAINELRASNAVEAAPRIGSRKAARAEEPVTARIRRRALPMDESVGKQLEPESVETKPKEQQTPNATMISTHVPASSDPEHRRRVSCSRERNQQQLRLF